ncbi:MAG TPA: hypothetical protein VGA99_08075 [bacterium]
MNISIAEILVGLAEVENKVDNCKLAIAAYANAMAIFTKEQFPEVYPRIERNLLNVLRFSEENG